MLRGGGGPALRLGFRQVKVPPGRRTRCTVSPPAAATASPTSPTCTPGPAGLPVATVERLARADAFRTLGLDRRRVLWEAKALERAPLPLFEHAEARRAPDDSGTRLPEMPAGQQVVEDYRSQHLSLKAHPLSFVREDLERAGAVTAAVLAGLSAGRRVQVAGLVLVRQRPGSA